MCEPVLLPRLALQLRWFFNPWHLAAHLAADVAVEATCQGGVDAPAALTLAVAVDLDVLGQSLLYPVEGELALADPMVHHVPWGHHK